MDCRFVSDSEDDLPIGMLYNRRKRKAQEEEQEQKRLRGLGLKPYKEVLCDPPYIDATKINTPHYIAASEYLPNWTMREALRELLTNTIDQARSVAEQFHILGEINIREDTNRLAIHIEQDLLAEVTWKFGHYDYVHSYCNSGVIKANAKAADVEKDVSTMCIELINYSSRLPWRSFQIGQTTKRKSKAMIGTHGEGLSAACVVLNRNGCNVTATCDHFTAKIVDLQNNIYFQLARRSAVEDTVKFKIVLPPPGNLVNVDELMATIRLPSAVSSVRSERGQLLTAPEHRGKQYNRGIYVSEDAKCLFGYNFLDPDKNLLQSRDRNSHAGDACLRECGSILSEAILLSEEVCQSVLACFVYADRPGAGGAASVQLYSDLGNGEHLTPAALQRLRSVHQRSILGDRPAIFCGNDTSLITQISEARDMAVVYCHAVLHNYQEVTQTFFQQLQDAACALPADSRLAQQQGAICALLRVEEVRASALELPRKLVGFWRVGQVVYVTALDSLTAQQGQGQDGLPGLSEENEVNVHETLRACEADLRATIQIVRLLQEDARRLAAEEGRGEGEGEGDGDTGWVEGEEAGRLRQDPKVQALLAAQRREVETQLRREWEQKALAEATVEAAAVDAVEAVAVSVGVSAEATAVRAAETVPAGAGQRESPDWLGSDDAASLWSSAVPVPQVDRTALVAPSRTLPPTTSRPGRGAHATTERRSDAGCGYGGAVASTASNGPATVAAPLPPRPVQPAARVTEAVGVPSPTPPQHRQGQPPPPLSPLSPDAENGCQDRDDDLLPSPAHIDTIGVDPADVWWFRSYVSWGGSPYNWHYWRAASAAKARAMTIETRRRWPENNLAVQARRLREMRRSIQDELQTESPVEQDGAFAHTAVAPAQTTPARHAVAAPVKASTVGEAVGATVQPSSTGEQALARGRMLGMLRCLQSFVTAEGQDSGDSSDVSGDGSSDSDSATEQSDADADGSGTLCSGDTLCGSDSDSQGGSDMDSIGEFESRSSGARVMVENLSSAGGAAREDTVRLVHERSERALWEWNFEGKYDSFGTGYRSSGRWTRQVAESPVLIWEGESSVYTKEQERRDARIEERWTAMVEAETERAEADRVEAERAEAEAEAMGSEVGATQTSVGSSTPSPRCGRTDSAGSVLSMGKTQCSPISPTGSSGSSALASSGSCSNRGGLRPGGVNLSAVFGMQDPRPVLGQTQVFDPTMDCTQCDDVSEDGAVDAEATGTQIDDDCMEVDEETELNTSGLTDTSHFTTTTAEGREDSVAQAPLPVLPSGPRALLCAPLYTLVEGGQGSAGDGRRVLFAYCGMAPSGALLYDGLCDPTTLQSHSALLHAQPGVHALLTALCGEYKFQVVLFRARPPVVWASEQLSLAVRIGRKGLWVNVTEGESEAVVRTVEALQGLLRTITLMDMLE